MSTLNRRLSIEQVDWLVLVAFAIPASLLVGLLQTNVNPWIVVPLVGFSGVGVLMLAKPDAATLTGIFLLYSNLSVVAAHNGVPTQIAGGVVLALLGFPLFYQVVLNHQRVIITPILLLMGVYLGLQLLSTAFSNRPSLSYARINTYVTEGLLIYFLTLNAVRHSETLRRGIWVLLLAGSLMGGFTVYQGLTGTYDNEFGGFAQVTASTANVGEEDALGNTPQVRRLAGPIGEKNRYAQIMVVLLPLCITRLYAERKWLLRFAALASFGLILGGTLYTYSRGGGVAIVVMFLAMVPLGIGRFRYLVILGGALILIVSIAVPSYFYRLLTIENVSSLLSGDPQAADTSVQGRATENLATLYVFRDHPFLGIGPGQTSSVIREYARSIGFRLLDPNRRSHNMYLEELADTGVIGFVGFMSIVVLTMYQLFNLSRRSRGRDPDTFYLTTGLLLSVIVYLTTAAFLHLSYARYYWFILGFAGAAIYIVSQKHVTQDGADLDVADEASRA